MDPADAPPDDALSSSHRLIRAVETATHQLKELTSLIGGMVEMQRTHHAAMVHELSELHVAINNVGRPPWAPKVYTRQ